MEEKQIVVGTKIDNEIKITIKKGVYLRELNDILLLLIKSILTMEEFEIKAINPREINEYFQKLTDEYKTFFYLGGNNDEN